jgi:hypothetical protein
VIGDSGVPKKKKKKKGDDKASADPVPALEQIGGAH